MGKEIEQLFPTNLSDSEEEALILYSGVKRDTFKDGKLIESIDTRDLTVEKLKYKKLLKQVTRDSLLSKFPLNKQLNFDSLTEYEKLIYSEVKQHYLDQYELIKIHLNAAPTLDELEYEFSLFKEHE